MPDDSDSSSESDTEFSATENVLDERFKSAICSVETRENIEAGSIVKLKNVEDSNTQCSSGKVTKVCLIFVLL